MPPIPAPALHRQNIEDNGFTVIDHVFIDTEADALLQCIAAADASGPAFRRNKDLFAGLA